jgi:hypothetical protein
VSVHEYFTSMNIHFFIINARSLLYLGYAGLVYFINIIPRLCLGYAGLYLKKNDYKSLDLMVHIDLFYLGSYGYRFMALSRPYLR